MRKPWLHCGWISEGLAVDVSGILVYLGAAFDSCSRLSGWVNGDVLRASEKLERVVGVDKMLKTSVRLEYIEELSAA